METFTILSQQNESDIKTFILLDIYKRFPVTVVNDFVMNVAPEDTPPLNKRRIGNAENLINAAAFNRINTVCDNADIQYQKVNRSMQEWTTSISSSRGVIKKFTV